MRRQPLVFATLSHISQMILICTWLESLFLVGGRVPNLTIFDHYVYNTSNAIKPNLRKNTEFLKIIFTGNNKNISKRSNLDSSKVFVCYVFGSWYVILLLPGIITKITSNHRQNTIV